MTFILEYDSVHGNCCRGHQVFRRQLHSEWREHQGGDSEVRRLVDCQAISLRCHAWRDNENGFGGNDPFLDLAYLEVHGLHAQVRQCAQPLCREHCGFR